MHRFTVSLTEELEAVDWYNQHVDASKAKGLKAILAHNRDEEKEHAAMLLDRIRRRDHACDKELKDYLFTEKPITEMEHEHKGYGLESTREAICKNAPVSTWRAESSRPCPLSHEVGRRILA